MYISGVVWDHSSRAALTIPAVDNTGPFRSALLSMTGPLARLISMVNDNVQVNSQPQFNAQVEKVRPVSMDDAIRLVLIFFV